MKKLFLSILNVLFVATLSFALLIGLYACNKNNNDDNSGDSGEQGGEGGQQEEVFKAESLTTILADYKNNQNLMAEGVVYGVLKNGFYVADSALGRVFVLNSDSNVTFGDKVQITGQFSIVGGFPQIKNVTKLTKVASEQASPVELENLTVDQIKALDHTQRTGVYGKLVKLQGALALNSYGQYVLTTDEGKKVLFANTTSSELLPIDTRVEMSAIVHQYSSSEAQLTVVFTGKASDIEAKEISWDELLQYAKDDIAENLVTSVYGKLTLPSKHTNFSLNYAWSAPASTCLTIDENNIVTVTNPATDSNETLKVVVSDSKEHSTELEYQIVVHAIVKRSVSEFNADVPVINQSDAIVNGVVVAITRNQSNSLRTYVLQDKVTTDIVTLDFYEKPLNELLGFTSDSVKAIKMGDEITVTSKYRSKASNDRPTLIDATNVVIESHNNPINQHIETAIEIHNAEEAYNLAANWADYTGKLIKFDNPYLNFSTGTTPPDTQFVRMGFSPEGDKSYGPDGRNVFLALLLACNNTTLGGDNWYKVLDIPFSGNGAKQCGVTIYGYCLYVSSTIIQFAIPDQSCFVTSPEVKAEMLIRNATLKSVLGGSTMALIANTAESGAITWTSSDDEVINPTTGAVKDVSDNTEVVLTAHYSIADVDYQIAIEVSVMKNAPLTVKEVLELNDGANVKFTGIVVGYASDANAKEFRKGIIVMDPATGKMVPVDGLGVLYGKEYPNYVDSAKKAIKLGDEVLVRGTYNTSSPYISNASNPQPSRKRVTVETAGEVTILSSDNALTFNTAEATVVDSTEKMAALVEDIEKIEYYSLIKLVGTADAPIYLGGSASSAPFNVKVFMTNAADNNGTKYSGRTFSLNSATQTVMAGEDWLPSYLGIEGPFIGPNSTNAAIPYEGELYVVIAYLTSTYYQCMLVNMPGFNLTPVDAERTKVAALSLVPTTVEVEDGKMAPLETNTHLTGDIVWASSDPSLLNVSTWDVVQGTTDATVTITGTYTYKGSEMVVNKEVTIPGKQETVLSVGQVLGAANGASVIFTGVVAAFTTHGNSAEDGNGIIVMDNTDNKMVIVDGLTGTYPSYKDANETTIEIGQPIKVYGALAVSGTRYSVTQTSVTVEEKVALNFNDANAIVVNNDSEFTALFASDAVKYGTLIKLVGTDANPIHIGGSSTDAAKVNFKVYYANATTNAESQVGGKGVVLKGVSNVPNAGEDWYKTLFPGVNGPFIAPDHSKDRYCKDYTGVMYMVICHSTSSYWQCSIVNVAGWSLTQKVAA